MPKTPKKLRKGDKANFETLRKACKNNDLALLSAIRKNDGANVALVCAMQFVNTPTGGEFQPVPVAVMIEGNPYELFEDPTV